MGIRFSIIIPVYMVEKYLEECIESVISQSFSDFEIILVDDGSKDKCPFICDNYKMIDNRVRVIHKENGGLSSARNAGISIALGDYVIFLDSDDCLAENALFELNRAIADFPDVLITQIYNTHDVKKNDYPIALFDLPSVSDKYCVFKFIFSKNDYVWPAPQYIVKRELIKKEQLLFQEGFYHEDVYWTSVLLSKADSFNFYNRVWYVRRFEREGSITSVVNPKRTKDMLLLSEMLFDEQSIEKLPSEERKLLLSYVSKATIWSLGFCKKYEKKDNDEISVLLKEKHRILNYTTKGKQKIFVMFFKVLGASMAIRVLKLLL